eukprot:TRINITY_DN4118_c0_g1_i2.p1 TRINITY_DN4118_c0_g1~~TRINITY_DN4118_c0_g1_i2.p1  ORF type:complete len:364 (+),score=76.04 TRINITY_DN4118_c0_g1_i2:384-1475(+)
MSSSSAQLPIGINPANVDGFLKKEFLYKFSIDVWINDPVLSQHTFETVLAPITWDEGKALYATCQRKGREGLSQKEVELLSGLENRIDKAISALGGNAFVKLNHRSPKDVVMFSDNQKLKKIFAEKLSNLEESDYVGVSNAWNSAALLSLKVQSGKEALYLFSQSFRISTDLNTDLEYEDFFRSQVVVRKFYEINPAFEFRAFVSKNHLTALSQYESGLYYPELVEKKELVENQIVHFWNSTVKDRLQLESYVIDFYVHFDHAHPNGKVYIVELNPFHAHTSACLFSWKHDRETILNGPFQMRINEHPPTEKGYLLPPSWEKFAVQYYSQTWKKQALHLIQRPTVVYSLSIAAFLLLNHFKVI